MGIINANNLEAARKSMRKEPSPVIILGQNDLFNRKILEHGKFDVLLSPERGERKDSLKFLDSGMNEILGRIARKKGIRIGINMEEIRNLGKKEKAARITRIRQNIMLCRKTGARLEIVGSGDERNSFSLLISLGASTTQARQAIYF